MYFYIYLAFFYMEYALNLEVGLNSVCLLLCHISQPCSVALISLQMIEECVWRERRLMGDMRGDSGGSVRE